MSPEPTFLGAVATKIAVDLTKDVLSAAARSVRRKFDRPETRKALDDAVHAALETSLEPLKHEPHLQGLLEDFLKHEDVVDELANLVDPRPDKALDFNSLVASLREQGFVRSDFPDFKLAAFLDTFAREFYVAVARTEELQKVLELRILAGLLGEASRTADAAEEIAANTGSMAAELAELKQLAKEGSEDRLVQVVNLFVSEGSIPALQGYEVLVAALNDQGLALNLDPVREVLEIEGGSFMDEKALPLARRNALETAAMKLRREVVEHPPSADELDALEERYRQHLVRWFENLTFQGMMRAPRPIVLPLEDVYVELRAVAEVPEAADAFSVEERRLLLELKDEEGRVDPERERDLMSQLDALRRERWSRTLPDRRSIAETLHDPEQRAFVILGDPGSGKTTLLHYLALAYARGAESAANRLGVPEAEVDRLPIFAPLAAFDDMRSRDKTLTLRKFLALYYDTRRGLPGLEALFERAIRSGRALILLDGLDEVLDVQTRRFVAEQVSALAGEWTPRGVRFMLSSRVVGYREAPVSGNVSTLTVLDFGESEIRTFVRQWARAFEVWTAGSETPEALRQAQVLELDVMQDVRSNPSVRRLAANPLMLTMLALLRRQTGIRLPHRRIELYESYVKTLLENWVYARSLDAREESLDLLDRHQAENVLIPLALWLQEEKPSGTAGQVEIRRKLTDICLEEEGLDRDGADRKQLREAQEMATRFLREMREMSGLIVERGQDAFGFLHLTFQEYFAGRALAQKSDERRWKIVRKHLHDPRWREPLMLCAGRLGVVENRREQATKLVASILDCEDPTEEDLHRHLLLALAIACDDVYLEPQLMERIVASAVGCLPTKVYVLARAIMGFLAQLVVNGDVEVERCFDPIWESGDQRLRRDAVDVLGRLSSTPAVRKNLSLRLSDADWNVFERTLKALSSQVGSDADIRNALIEKLNDDNYPVRQSAMSALSSHVGSDADIRNAIVEKLNDDNWQVRQSAVSALSSQVGSDADIRNALIEKLNDDNYFVRQSAVSALSSHVGSDADIRNAIIQKLNDDNWQVIRSAMSALSSHVGSDADIRNALIEKLNEGYYSVGQSAVSALSSQVGSDADIRNAIIQKLNDVYYDVRQSAVSALSSQVGIDADIRNAIVEKLNDGYYNVRQSAVSALSSQVGNNADIRNAIIEKLNDVYYDVRQSAVSALSSQVGSDADIRNAIIEKLNDVNYDVRRASLKGLAGSLLEDLRVLTSFQGQLRDDYWQVRQVVAEVVSESCVDEMHFKIIRGVLGAPNCVEATQSVGSCFAALGDLAYSDIRIYNRAVRNLVSSHWRLRQSAVSALSSQVGNDADIRNAIIEKLNDDNWQVRQSAVSALSSQVGSDADIRNAIIEKLNDDYDVCKSAVSALSSQVGSDADIRNAIIKKLNDSYYPVRQSAVSALSSQVGSDADIRNAIIEKLNDDNWQVRQSAVSAMSSQVGSDADIRNAIIGKLNEGPFVRQSAVSALSSQVGSDADIRNAIIEKLNDDYWQVRQSAVSALSSQVGSDADIRNTIIEKLNDDYWQVRQSAVSALSSQVGSDADIRNTIIEKLNDDYWQVRQSAVSALSSQVGNDADIRNALVEKLNDDNYSVRQSAVSALSSQVGSDADIRNAIRNVLTESIATDVFPVRMGYFERIIAKCAPDVVQEFLSDSQDWVSVDTTPGSPHYIPDDQTRERQKRIAQWLGETLPQSRALQDRMLELLTEVRWSSRLGAVLTLLSWPGGPPPEIMDKIVESLDDLRGLESYPARLTAASSLVNRDEHSAAAVAVCLEALEYGTQPWEHLPESPKVRKQAALVLGKLEPLRYDGRVYEKLLRVMKQDEDGDVRDAAYNALVRLARVRDEYLRELRPHSHLT